jgi:GNAT superfamily N-acetyltransferase
VNVQVTEPPQIPEGFLDLPARIYADDPFWIPEEPFSVAASLDPAGNPWFERGTARLLSIPGQARAALFLDPALRHDGRPAAFIGLFETAGERSATLELLDTAAVLAREAGSEALIGPVTFGTALGYRLRLDPPDEPNFPGEPHNPQTYQALLLEGGFRPVRRYVTQHLPGPVAVAAAHLGDAPLAALLGEGFRLERLDAAAWLARLPALHAMVEEVFAEGFAATPMSLATFSRWLGAPMARRLCPKTSALLLDPAGGMAAFVLVVPDYGPLAAQGAGASRVPASELSYEVHWPALVDRGQPRGIIKTVAVRRPYRGRGAARALLSQMIAPNPYSEWLGALIREDNPSRRLGPPGLRERRYALYAQPLREGAR